MIDPRVFEIIELFALHEEKISLLYRVFSEKFPDSKDFWEQISDEEVNHAEIIRSLIPGIKSGKVNIKGNRFSKAGIETSIEYVEKNIDRAKAGELTAKNAGVIAHDLESALLEKEWFIVVDTDDDEVKDVLNKLRMDGVDHRARITALNEVLK